MLLLDDKKSVYLGNLDRNRPKGHTFSRRKNMKTKMLLLSKRKILQSS